MTGSLVTHPAFASSSLSLGLLSMYHHKSIENRQSFDTNSMMNQLVAGSIAENNSVEYIRPSALRYQENYDPFVSQIRNRYSPPRGYENSPTTNVISSTRTLPLYSDSEVRPPLQHWPATFPGFEHPSHTNRDGFHKRTVTDESQRRRRQSQESYGPRTSSPSSQPLSQGYIEYEVDERRRDTESQRNTGCYHTRRRPFNQDEFDGPSQFLPLPIPQQDSIRAQDLAQLPTSLEIAEQDEIIRRANDILAECAFHFIAKYQFPVPLERDKPRVQTPADREWTEWAYLLKRLATKRRIPARVLFDNQIKQFVTVLENSIAVRQGANKSHTNLKPRPKDDWYILQLVSAGTQVSKILMDSLAMQQLCDLYTQTEAIILDRRRRV